MLQKMQSRFSTISLLTTFNSTAGVSGGVKSLIREELYGTQRATEKKERGPALPRLT